MWGIVLSGFFAPTAEAKRLEDVIFQPEYRLGDTRLMFQGAGVMKYLLFTVSAAAFYRPENVASDDPLADVPKRLELEYFHAIKAKDFVELTNTWIARNNKDEKVAQIRTQIDRFNALYQAVEPGDRYAITYQPGHGTELSLNGTVLGKIEGADFARALFSIWLGPNPVSKSLKSALLQ
jgi:hypothetical protein